MAELYRGNKIWTQDEINLLKEQVDKGMIIEEIAKLHDRTVTAITSRLEYIGFIMEYPQSEIDDIISRLKSGKALVSVAKFYKRKPQEVVKKLRELGLEELIPETYLKSKSKKVEEKKEDKLYQPYEIIWDKYNILIF